METKVKQKVNLKVLTKDEDIYSAWNVGKIYTTYKKLYNLLGEPTYSEKSADEKTNKEWCVLFNEEYFTIYDFKYYDGWKNNEVIKWNIGGKTNPADFIEYLESKL